MKYGACFDIFFDADMLQLLFDVILKRTTQTSILEVAAMEMASAVELFCPSWFSRAKTDQKVFVVFYPHCQTAWN